MQNNPHTNPFDEMLKQSLEGAQMPVPTGVWESVGSSIASKSIAAAKLGGIKLLIIKSLSGVILAGGLGLGIYKIVEKETIVKNEQNSAVPNTVSPSDTIVPNQLTIETKANVHLTEAGILPYDSSIEQPLYTNLDSIHNRIVAIENTKEDGNNNQNNTVQSEVMTTEAKVETHKSEIAHKNEIKDQKTETSVNDEPATDKQPVFIEPSNVFTPDGDGLNDNFKIIVENEKSFVLQIFDESGKLVFESQDKNKAWDGKNISTGQLCKKGYYYYKVIVEYKNGYKKKETRGISLF